MLLHSRRIQGNLNGAGYVNPYNGDRPSALYMQPLCYSDHTRNLNLKREQSESKQQSGSGLVEGIASTQAILLGLQKAGDMYASETGTRVKNFYGKNINPHPNWRPSFAGEKHMIHSSGNTFNYLGPHTNIKERLQRGDPPLDGAFGLDAQAKIHDTDYMNAKSLADVRKADKKFVKNISKAKANPVSKKIITSAMKAKMTAEDLGLLDQNKYSQINVASTKDTPMSGKGLKKTRKMGKYPDSYLRSKLIKQYGKSKKKLINKMQE